VHKNLTHRNNPHLRFLKASDKHAKAFATECGINTNSSPPLIDQSKLVASSQVQNARSAEFLFQYNVQSSLDNGRHEGDSIKHSALASRPGVVVNVAVEGQVYLVGKEQIIKSVLKGGGIAAWVLRPSLHPPPGRLECNIDSNPEALVHSIKAHNGMQLVGLNAILEVLQRIQYPTYKHNGMQLVGLDAKSSTPTVICSRLCACRKRVMHK